MSEAVTYFASTSNTDTYKSPGKSAKPQFIPGLAPIIIPAVAVTAARGATATVILNVPAPYMSGGGSPPEPGVLFYVGMAVNASTSLSPSDLTVLGAGSISSTGYDLGRKPATIVATYQVPSSASENIAIGAAWATVRGTTGHLGGVDLPPGQSAPTATLTVTLTNSGPAT